MIPRGLFQPLPFGDSEKQAGKDGARNRASDKKGYREAYISFTDKVLEITLRNLQ